MQFAQKLISNPFLGFISLYLFIFVLSFITFSWLHSTYLYKKGYEQGLLPFLIRLLATTALAPMIWFILEHFPFNYHFVILISIAIILFILFYIRGKEFLNYLVLCLVIGLHTLLSQLALLGVIPFWGIYLFYGLLLIITIAIRRVNLN